MSGVTLSPVSSISDSLIATYPVGFPRLLFWCAGQKVYYSQGKYSNRIGCEWVLLHGVSSNYSQTAGKGNLLMDSQLLNSSIVRESAAEESFILFQRTWKLVWVFKACNPLVFLGSVLDTGLQNLTEISWFAWNFWNKSIHASQKLISGKLFCSVPVDHGHRYVYQRQIDQLIMGAWGSLQELDCKHEWVLVQKSSISIWLILDFRTVLMLAVQLLQWTSGTHVPMAHLAPRELVHLAPKLHFSEDFWFWPNFQSQHENI